LYLELFKTKWQTVDDQVRDELLLNLMKCLLLFLYKPTSNKSNMANEVIIKIRLIIKLVASLFPSHFALNIINQQYATIDNNIYLWQGK
jgi:hypothetical protein